MAELKKCPFCGGEMEILNVSESPLYVHDYIFGCKNHCIHSVRSFMTEDEAIKACNKRADDKEIGNKAIDEFTRRLLMHLGSWQDQNISDDDTSDAYIVHATLETVMDVVKGFAKQMKEGV